MAFVHTQPSDSIGVYVNEDEVGLHKEIGVVGLSSTGFWEGIE